MSEFKNAHTKGYVTFYNREGEIIGVFPYPNQTYEGIKTIGDDNLNNWEYYCIDDSGLGSHKIGAPIKVNIDTGEYYHTGFMFNVNQLITLAKGYNDIIMTGRYHLELRYTVDSIHSIMVPLSGKYNGDIIINMPEVKKSRGFYNPEQWLGYMHQNKAYYYFNGYTVDKQTGEITWHTSEDDTNQTQKSIPDYNDEKEIARREKSLQIASDILLPDHPGEVINLADEVYNYLRYGKLVNKRGN